MTGRAAAGFTLIEVLVALAIVAVALSAGIKAAGALINNAQRLADVSAAQWCADNELAGMKLGRNTPGVGDLEFQCQQLGRTYPGHLVVRQHDERPMTSTPIRRILVEDPGSQVV